MFFPSYYFIHPVFNESQKWRYDYIFIAKNTTPKKKMEGFLLDRFFEAMKFSVLRNPFLL